MDHSYCYNAIHVGCTAVDFAHFIELTEQAGGRAFDLSVAGVATADDLVQRSIEVFEIPWPIVGLDSALSVGSELYWMDCSRHFVTVVYGIDALVETMRSELAWLLVSIVHRMSGAGDHYAVAFPECGHTDELRALLDHQNAELSAPPNFPWITRADPIPIVDHRQCEG